MGISGQSRYYGGGERIPEIRPLSRCPSFRITPAKPWVPLDPAVLLPSAGEGAHYSNYVRIRRTSPILRRAGQRPLERNPSLCWGSEATVAAASIAVCGQRSGRCHL